MQFSFAIIRVSENMMVSIPDGQSPSLIDIANITLEMEKESTLIPTLRSENLADVSTKCFSLHRGITKITLTFKQHNPVGIKSCSCDYMLWTCGLRCTVQLRAVLPS